MLQPVKFLNLNYNRYNMISHHALNAYETREELENRLREERSKIQTSINDNDSKQSDYANKISELENRIDKEQADINSDKSRLVENRQKYENRRSKLQSALHEDEQHLQNDRSKLNEVRSQLSDLKEKHNELENRLNNVK